MNGLKTPTPSAGGDSARHFIDLLRSLADPIRLRLIRLLETRIAAEHSGLSVGELAEILKLPQSTVSRHLKTITDAGLAAQRRDGTSTFYSLAPAPDQTVTTQLRVLARSQLAHDLDVRNDAHRLAAVLRKREPAADSFFGKHAPQWDQIRAQWFGDTFHLEGLLALLNPAWTVADIGTGTGAMLPLLAPHVQQILAVEPNLAMLKGARNRVKECGLTNVDLRQGTAEHLPIDEASVDVALLALVLAYTAAPAFVLREVRRILKPAGLILIMDLQPHTVELFREKLNHRHMGFSQEQLTQWLIEAGFGSMRWHPLSPQKGRSKESATPIPDLFALRAEVV
jgi:ubiquinone/menaquinone biosynthesis C-methylase UbiE/DNA-binding transcriptional ArsR family regulator